jgi:hypothetical protein
VGGLHDPRPSGRLDRGRGHVDPDVQRPRERTDRREDEGEREHRVDEAWEDRGDPVADERGRDRHARPAAVDEPSGQDHGRQGRGGNGEERDAELGHGRARLLLHVRDDDRPDAPVGAEGREGEERPARLHARRCRAAS